MPVEIKELVIRAVVQQGETPSAADSEGESPGREGAVIEACVREVLKILRRAKER